MATFSIKERRFGKLFRVEESQGIRALMPAAPGEAEGETHAVGIKQHRGGRQTVRRMEREKPARTGVPSYDDSNNACAN